MMHKNCRVPLIGNQCVFPSRGNQTAPLKIEDYLIRICVEKEFFIPYEIVRHETQGLT